MPKAAAYTLAWSSLHLAYELRAPDGDVALRMQYEESAWFAWLAQGSSFAFEGRTPAGCCLLRQETKQRGTGYWYAYQRNGKKLRKKYVGKAAAVTLARLEEVARLLNANHPGQPPRQEMLAQPEMNLAHSLPPSALAAPEESMARCSPPPNASDPPHDPLRAAKLHVPRPHSHLLHRPHLTERLQRGQEEGALILLSAPAGYGKTTLLADWLAEKNTRVAWLTLASEENEPARFLSYLIAALQTISPGTGATVLPFLQSPQAVSLEMVLTVLRGCVKWLLKQHKLVCPAL